MLILTRKLRPGHWPRDSLIYFLLNPPAHLILTSKLALPSKFKILPLRIKSDALKKVKKVGKSEHNREKARRERSKSRKRSGHQEMSSDSEYKEGLDDACEDLNSPYKRPKPALFTQRITRFKYHKMAKLPQNIRVYEGNKDPEDHLGGAARHLFDDLDPKSVDSFKELSQKFLEEFSQQKRYAKDPTKIHDIKRRQNDGLQAFMDQFKYKSSHIKGVSPVLRIFAFMRSRGHPELAKKLNDKIPKTMDEMFERLRKRIDEVVASGKLAHLVKDIHRNNQQNGNLGRNGVKVINMIRQEGNRKRSFEERRPDMMNELTFPAIPRSQLTDEPIILEGMIEANQVPRILIDGESLSKIMYEHYFRNLGVNIWSRLKTCRIPMIGFSWETYHPLGVIDLRVTLGRDGRSKTMLMEFAIIKCCSSYNIIIRRTRIRRLRAVGSTIHSMIKFPTNQGVITIETSSEALQDANTWKRTKSNSGIWPTSYLMSHEKTWGQENAKEPFTIIHEHPDQYVTTGTTLTTNRKQLLADVLRENREVQIDYSSLNKVCAKDTYPLPEEGEELASLMGYPYKYFLRLLKEYSQIRMAEDDKEKTSFHTEEGKKGTSTNLHSKIPENSLRKHKVKVVTDGSMEETLKLVKREGRLGKWAIEIRKETIEEGSGVGIILNSPKEKMYSHAIRLKFKASNRVMDCEALLAGLATSANQGIKDLYVFIDLLTLVTQAEGNHTLETEQERRSVDRAGNYKARIPQTGSIGRYQNKTISIRDKQQQERQSDKQGTKDKSSLDASAKLTRAKLNKRSGYADLSKDKLGLESPPEFRRSWCVEGHVRSRVISSVLAQRYLRTIRKEQVRRRFPTQMIENPLALSWRQTSRLDSDVRESLVLGFPSISLVIVSGQSGTLVEQGSACNRGCGGRLAFASVLQMDLFAFICHSDPTKVRIWERETVEREVKLLTLTKDRTVLLNPLASAAFGDSGDNIDKFFDEGKKQKMKVVGDASGSTFPPKKLREDYHAATSNIEGKCLAVIRGLVSDGSSVLSGVTKPPTVVPVTPTSDDGPTNFLPKVRVKSKNLEIFGDSTSAGEENVNVVARQVCLGAKVRVRAEHTLEQKDRLKDKCSEQTALLSERDAEIFHLKSLLSLKEYEAVEAIRLRDQLSIVEAAYAAKGNELRNLKERKFLSCDELSSKVTSFKAQRDMLADQRSSLESAFELFKGYMEAMQDEQATVLGNKAIGCAVNKGIQDGLKARVDHGKARRDLSMIEAYDPSAEARYIDVINVLGTVDFSLLSEGKIEEKSLSLTNVMVPFTEPLSLNSLIGEASTSAIPATTKPITILSMTFSSFDVVPPLSISNDQALDTEPNDEDPPVVTFEKEELETFSKVVGSTTVMRPNTPQPWSEERLFVKDSICHSISTCLVAYGSCLLLFFWENFFRERVYFLLSPLGTCSIENSLKVLMGTCFPSLSIIRTALIASFVAARLESLRLASFPFNLCMSFKHFGDGRLRTASTLSEHTFNPSAFTLYPRNVPSLISKETFERIPTQGLYLQSISVIFVGFLANTSRLRLSRPHRSFRPSSVKVKPMAIVFPNILGGLLPESFLLWLDKTSWILLSPGLPMIPLYGDGDLTIMKFIHAEVKCFSLPIFTSNDICHSSHIIYPLNPTSGVVVRTIWLLTSGQNLLKQCSYRISKDGPPSTYMRGTKCPTISTLIIIGPSVPSSSPTGGNEITVSKEKVWVILCLATLCHGCTIRIASGLSLPELSCFEHFLDLPLQVHALIDAKISFGVFVRRVHMSCFRLDLCWFWKPPFLKSCFCPASGCFHDGNDFFRSLLEAATSPMRNKEANDKIREGTLNLDDGTSAMTVVFGKEKGGYARGVTPMAINNINSSAYEVDETQSSVVVCDKDVRIQKKSNGLVTSEKVMETMEPFKTVRPKKMPKSRRNGSPNS
uniref:Reverse transcriptase domain-containing protein n=1 Tax=Tanacetum cinerariifolium TaxID=118510 RepID=A0A699GSP8_TANCI|nr:reverse transcriptase domain-containing protein [Tanacetum cinerariifolium]